MGQPVAAGTLLLPSGSPSDPSPPAPQLRAHTKQHIRSGSSGHSRSSCPPRQERARAAAAARVPPGTAVGAGSGAACRKWGPWFLLLFFSLSSEVLEGGRFHGNRRGRQGPEVITQNNEFSSRSLRAETVPVRGSTHPAPPPSRNPQISRKTWWCFKCIARKLIRKHSFFNRERHTIFSLSQGFSLYSSPPPPPIPLRVFQINWRAFQRETGEEIIEILKHCFGCPDLHLILNAH